MKLPDGVSSLVYRDDDGREIVRKLQPEWIPVSERLPEEEQDVLIQYGNSMRIAYHKIDSTVYESPFKDLDDTGWYDENDEFIDGTLQVDAWMPLPEPYREDGEMNVE